MGRHHAEVVDWFGKMKKQDERRMMEELHQQWASQMIKSAEGIRSRSPHHGKDERRSWRKEEDVRLFDRCEAKRREWAKHR